MAAFLSSAPRGFARSRVLARLVVSLAQTGEPARRLVYGKWRLLKKNRNWIYFFNSTSPQIRFEVKFIPIHFVNKRDAWPAPVTRVAPETSVAFFWRVL